MHRLVIASVFLISMCGAVETPLLSNGIAAFDEVWCGGMTKSLVDCPDKGGKALKMVVATKPAQVWNAETWVNGMANPIAAGETVRIKLSARCTAGGTGAFMVGVGMRDDPWTPIACGKVELESEWKDYTFTGVAKEDYAADKVRIGFSAGFQVQTVEVANFTVVNLGKK